MANHKRSAGNFNDLVNPHATPASSRDLTEGWFTDEMPDMNQENPLVSKYLIQNALWWVETAHLDAIRIDTFPYVGRAFWHDFDAALHHAYPNLTTVGEIFHRDPTITSFFAGGREHAGIDTGLDTPFDFPVYFAVRDVLAGNKPMTDLAATLRQDSLYPHPEHLVQFFGNHDTTRFLTAAGGSLPRLKEALGLLATLRGTPELYSGDEIAMEGGGDPDNRRDFPGGFPPTGPNGQSSAFTASGRTHDQQETFVWTAALFSVRKSHTALQGGAQQDLFVDDSSFVYIRTNSLKGCSSAHDKDAVVAVVNKKAEPRILLIRSADTALAGCNQFEPLAPANLATARSEGGSVSISIPGESFAMFSVR
ncbi:alpha-amylase family glycosyl hydrolase [Edaphobacter sp. DSM 109919]|uniref:Alpha-amylase family glycosyl hydrolase n=1 Tax=Edaphobacter paludis TaxID=3035702 RepID=A0AAU7CXX1_9BACT